MTEFKFFKGYVGTLNVMDGQTYATASFYNPQTLTDDERLTRINERIQIDEQFRNQGIMSQEQYNLNRDMFAQQERVRRQRIENDNQIRLYRATRVTTVNPKWWMKIKMELQELSIFFKSSPYGIMFLWASATIGVILIIAKILNVY
jgi:hypothetical protein